MRGHLEAGLCDDGWLTPPPTLSLSCTKLPIPLSPAQIYQSLNPRDPSPLVHVFPALSSNMLSLLLPHTESRCTRISCILHVSIFLTDLTSSSLFLSLSPSLCFVRFVSYSLIHIHTIFPALSAPSSQALSARFIHTLGYVQNVAFIMADVELLLVLLHPTK